MPTLLGRLHPVLPKGKQRRQTTERPQCSWSDAHIACLRHGVDLGLAAHLQKRIPRRMIGAAQGRYPNMTTDGRPPASTEPEPADTSPTDPPVYREASTPEEIEESQKDDD